MPSPAPLKPSAALLIGLLAALFACGDENEGPPPSESDSGAKDTASDPGEDPNVGEDPDVGQDSGGAGDPWVGDPAPLTRMTAEQYANTVRDLFAPIELGLHSFPVELEAAGGFENNVAVNSATPALVEAYQRSAAHIAGRVGGSLSRIMDCDPEAAECGRTWLKALARRAWRRPLTAEEEGGLLTDYDAWQAKYGTRSALELAIQLLLQSPEFLYFARFGEDAAGATMGDRPLSNWELASRLSYFLWNSMPDAELFRTAQSGQLVERAVLAEQAKRMLRDWRAVDMVVSFHRQNWDFDEVAGNPIDFDHYAPVFEAIGLHEEDDKSDYYYLEYSPQARFEPDVFVSRHLFHGDGRLSTLLTSNHTWVTPEVAHLAYRREVDDDQEPVRWQAWVPQEGNDDFGIFSGTYFPIELDPRKRAGYFTMVGFLIAKAGPRQPAPVRRGVTILERLLCRELAPPGDVPPLDLVEDEMPKTNREKYEIHSRTPACAGCHAAIDGIGLTFENYDSMGRFRTKDGGYPVDATGELLGTDQDGPVSDAVELMHKLGQSRSVHDCYTQQWFRYAFGRNETEADAPTLKALQEGFWGSQGDVLELVVNIAASYAFRHRSGQ